MKIIFCATNPHVPTGYAKIATQIANYLSQNHEVYYLAFQSFGGNAIERKCSENVNMLPVKDFGYDEIGNFVSIIKPDILFIYNDVLIIRNYIIKTKELKENLKFKTIAYLDLTYIWENHIKFIDDNVDKIVTFADFWTNHLIENGVSSDKLYTMLHPMDTNVFPMDNIKECRAHFGFKDEDFVILNLNRNSYRKQWGLTIEAFILFLKGNNFDKNIKLFCGCILQGLSYNIRDLITIFSRKHKLTTEQSEILSEAIRVPAQLPLETEQINMLYNACDVGLNTCGGEGFGLCNVEHQLVGRPQILTNTTSFKSLFSKDWSMLLDTTMDMAVPADWDNIQGLVELVSPLDYCSAMNTYFKDKNLRELHGQKGKEALQYLKKNQLFILDKVLYDI